MKITGLTGGTSTERDVAMCVVGEANHAPPCPENFCFVRLNATLAEYTTPGRNGSRAVAVSGAAEKWFLTGNLFSCRVLAGRWVRNRRPHSEVRMISFKRLQAALPAMSSYQAECRSLRLPTQWADAGRVMSALEEVPGGG